MRSLRQTESKDLHFLRQLFNKFLTQDTGTRRAGEERLPLRSRGPAPRQIHALPFAMLVPFYFAPMVSFYSGLDICPWTVR